MNNKEKRKTITEKYLFIGFVMAYPMALFLLMYVYVNFNSILMAFQHTSIDGSSYFVGLENFKKFFSLITKDGGLLNVSLINSLKMYVINFVIGVPLSIFFSYLMFSKVPGNWVIRGIIMIPQVISSMVIALLFKKFADSALPSLIKEITGTKIILLSNAKYAFGTAMFYMIWTAFGTTCIVYANAMNEIDTEVMESAKLDGISNMFEELWYIILPLIFPTLTTFIVTGFASILTATGPMMTFYYTNAASYMYNVGYYYSVNVLLANYSTFNMLSAGGLVMTFIMAPLTYLLSFLLEKYGPGVD